MNADDSSSKTADKSELLPDKSDFSPSSRERVETRPMDLAFSKMLRELLQNRGMSTTRLAKAVGISPKTVSDWMTGRVPRDLAAVRRCANHLNVSVHYLLYGEEDSQGPSTVSGHGEIHPGLYEITVKKVR